MEVVWIAAAFVVGLAGRQVGLPPLVGYLVAGFALNAFGLSGGETLEQIAHIGVLMLLFAIGLKLRLATLARPEVLAGGLVHVALGAAAFGIALAVLAGLSLAPAIVLGIALTFSSTVFAAKAFEEKGEVKSFHGRTAIGILILQDLIAVALMSLVSGVAISPWALAWLALPFAKGFAERVLDLSGHGELLLLYGLILALGVGGAGFVSVGLSGELGALVLGMLVADHPRARDLGQALWGLREVLLVAFFLHIGMAGVPSLDALRVVGLLLLALPFKTALYFFVLLRFRLRARSSLLAALALGTYSEFALIVAGVAVRNGRLDEQWLVSLAAAVAVSFALAAPLNATAHALYSRFEARLLRFQSDRRHPDDSALSFGGADVVVFGMGRVGAGAYEHIVRIGRTPIGLDSDPVKVRRLEEQGGRVLYADAEDPDFWHRLDLTGVRIVLLALPDLEAKCIAARELRRRGHTGPISAINAFPDEVPLLLEAGVDDTFSSYDSAGESFARHTFERLAPDRSSTSTT